LYGQWLERLQQRAASLVVMSVKKSVDTAFREAQVRVLQTGQLQQ
jgi:hypothetical protein